MTELADTIEARAAELAGRALEEMYANPFWLERFGERGRRRAAEDGRYHLTYLAEALRAESPEILAQYARWLRTVLVTRGMCSRHLAKNFSRLAAAIRDDGTPGGEQAVRYLEIAEAALIYPDGPARAIQLAAPAVADRGVALLYTRHPTWLERWGRSGQERCRDDAAYHLSYLADAVALGDSNLFADYIRWIAEFLGRRGIPREHLQELLIALDAALAELPPQARPAARRMLSAGHAALVDGQ